MKKVIFYGLLFSTLTAFGAGRISINVPSQTVKQGSLQKATLLIDPEVVQVFPLHKLQADPEGLGGVIFLQNVSSLVKSGDRFEAEATIVFIKKPESNPVKFKHGSHEIEIGWSNLEIIPTSPEQEFLFGSFEVPTPLSFLKWLLGALAIAIIGFALRKWILGFRKKRALRQLRASLKEQLVSARAYEEVVTLWQNKSHYLRSFPHISAEFKELEKTLFKHQFKPHQSETDKAEVMRAYREFLNKIQGGLSGI